MEVPQAAKGTISRSFSSRSSKGVLADGSDEDEDEDGSMSHTTVSPVVMQASSDDLNGCVDVSLESGCTLRATCLDDGWVVSF